MLKREVAQATLADFAVENWRESRAERLTALPQDLRHIGELMCLDDYRRHEDANRGLKAFGQLAEEARSLLFPILFPQIGEYVRQAYEGLLPTLPFQSGYARRAFRSTQWQHYHPRRQALIARLIRLTQTYDQPLDWYAAWTPYLPYGSDQLGFVFAAAINQTDQVGETVFEILCDSARGDHEIGAMGRHVVRSLLVANRPEGWQLMENMLVAAQRQEGLRQVILETIDEAHPQAFTRMLRVMVEQNLVRFSATVRAADVWFGLSWDVEQQRWVQAILVQTLALLEQPDQRAVALASDDPSQIFIALWVLAFEDIEQAIAAAKPLLQDARSAHRFVAAYLLRQIGVPEVVTAIAPSLADGDLRVAVQAFRATQYGSEQALAGAAEAVAGDWFEALEAFLARFSAKETRVAALVWPWMSESVSQADITGTMLKVWGARPIQRLIPYLPMMSDGSKLQVADRLIKSRPWDDQAKETIFGLVGDRSVYIRESVLRQLNRESYIPNPDEAQKFEALLTRKAADLRRGAISLLLKQDSAPVAASAQRLLTASKASQRLAGLELLDQLQQTKRLDCRQMAEAYVAHQPKRSASEQELIDRLLASDQAVPTLDDALGLSAISDRTPAAPPPFPERPMTLISASTAPILQALDDLLMQHRTTPVTIHFLNRTEEDLLGSTRWLPGLEVQQSRAENLSRLPLSEVWQSWWESRPAELRDLDGLELVRSLAAFSRNQALFYGSFSIFGSEDEPDWVNELRSQWFIPTESLQSQHIHTILHWLHYLYPPAQATANLLSAAQLTLAEINAAANRCQVPFDWRASSLLSWLTSAQLHYRQHPHEWTAEQMTQLWRLLRWVDQPDNPSLPRWCPADTGYGRSFTQTTDGSGFVKRMRPQLADAIALFKATALTTADLYEYLLGDRPMNGGFRDFQQLTQRQPHPLLKDAPALADIVEKCRDRILTIELARGDLPTAATALALSLSSITGIATVIKLLQNFGHEKFARGWLRDSQSKASVFSHLFRVSFPEAADTPADFTQQVKAANIKPQRLVELAIYAPQWARYVEQALGWPDLAESVWWFHAHTKDNAWQVGAEIRDLWSAQIAELTPLSSQDLIDGAVDVGWFQRIYQQLTPAKWAQLNDAAKYASGGGGHKRAQLFAEAMTSQTPRLELVQRIQAKRHQDTVRAIGLMPLKGKAHSKAWQADLLDRYQIIQEFLRSSRQFGSQRQASEKLAARIGLENLARTAGFVDPQRLEWAMEREAIADLSQGSVTVAVNDVAVSLSLTAEGAPQISVTKAGKSLKAIPAKLTKNLEIKALQDRKRDLTRQASRIRQSLERAMCRGDEFTGTELKALLLHPILQPMLSKLVFVSAEASGYPIGYPIGDELQGPDGAGVAIAPYQRLRIAHPLDFAQAKSWHLWQQQCFSASQVQPFKQIFRELYVLTSAEQQGQGSTPCSIQGSMRYAGHQINPRQTLALLAQRGWVAHPEEGIRRTFHDENLLVWIEFEEGWYTPTEVEGLTLDKVCFGDRRTYNPLALAAVPPRVFSEVMRDLDLVVSVAHQGGVDPEASASTVEMRAALLTETSRLLKLDNIRLQEPYALIEGSLGSYTLHLGSATVHRQPGGALCIVPVHAQHRGRLFLPFADDDPKTAEILAKALLLAKDSEIQDPTILEQLL